MLKQCTYAFLAICFQPTQALCSKMACSLRSYSPSEMKPVPIKVLAFDFDKTCTKEMALDIYKSREDYQKADKQTVKLLDEEWQRLESFYNVLLRKVVNPLKEAKSMPAAFDESGLRRFLKEYAVCDTLAVEELVKSKILKGIKVSGIREFAKGVELMPRLLDVLLKFKSLNLRMHVISLNFSKKFIQLVLTRNGALPIDVHSNELEFTDGLTTGNLDTKYMSAFDKEVQLQKILRNAENKPGITIYIGDSFNDLLALLKADVGIIIGKSTTMMKVCNDFGILVVPLCEWSYAEVLEKSSKLQKVLFSVNTWEEVEDFILMLEQKSDEKM